MVRRGEVSIGVPAAVGPDLARELAPAIEAAGFHALWINDTAGADALEVLAAAAAVTERLVLATRVLPIDRRLPGEILAGVHGLPEPRLVLGIGSGQAKAGALDLVRRSIRNSPGPPPRARSSEPSGHDAEAVRVRFENFLDGYGSDH